MRVCDRFAALHEQCVFSTTAFFPSTDMLSSPFGMIILGSSKRLLLRRAGVLGNQSPVPCVQVRRPATTNSGNEHAKHPPRPKIEKKQTLANPTHFPIDVGSSWRSPVAPLPCGTCCVSVPGSSGYIAAECCIH